MSSTFAEHVGKTSGASEGVESIVMIETEAVKSFSGDSTRVLSACWTADLIFFQRLDAGSDPPLF